MMLHSADHADQYQGQLRRRFPSGTCSAPSQLKRVMLGPVSVPKAKAVPDAQVSSEAGLADTPTCG